MNAPLRHPVIPAALARQETTCDRFGGPCCSWACCKAPVRHRAETVSVHPDYLDLDIPDGLAAALPGADILTVGRAAAFLNARAAAAFDGRPDRLFQAMEGD